MKKISFIVAIIIIFFAGSVWLSNSLSGSDSSIVSENGIHWHPSIQIYVKGKEVPIPKELGLNGRTESPIHTHEDVPIIHMEYSGKVTNDEIKLKRFFAVWHKTIHSFGNDVTMTVNGIPNTLLGNYEMHDGDKIIIRYR